MSEPEKKTLKIVVFGGGSLGGLLSHLLSTAPHATIQTTLICCSNAPTVSSAGYTLTTSLWGTHTFHPHRVISSPSSLAPDEHFDYALVTTKSLPPSPGKRPHLAEYPIPKEAPIVLIQNGIGIEQPYRDAFPENPIVSAVAYITASQPSPGHILQVGTTAALEIGLFDQATTANKEKTAFLAQLLTDAQFPTSVKEDIQTSRWTKLGWNGSWNIVCAITGLETHAYLATGPEALELVEGVIREIARTAVAAGARVEEGEMVRRHVEWTMSAPSVAPSTLQDRRSGAVMEVEVLCGNVWREAQRRGVEVPRVK